MTAFANTNTDGGCVFIGVGDKGKIKEVVIGRETIKQIADKISAHTDPVLYPKIEEVGTGTNKMVDWCIDWGLPEPDFEQITGDFVVTFRKSKLTEEYLDGLGLNERQKKAIKYIQEHGSIDRKIYRNICNVEKTVAHQELAGMIERGITELIGKGRGAHYILRTKRTINGRLTDDKKR
ncbi:putative DNA binding domain-containing protein [bacterium]|nr:putative DNA binding domain-containing protein [bacterium]